MISFNGADRHSVKIALDRLGLTESDRDLLQDEVHAILRRYGDAAFDISAKPSNVLVNVEREIVERADGTVALLKFHVRSTFADDKQTLGDMRHSLCERHELIVVDPAEIRAINSKSFSWIASFSIDKETAHTLLQSLRALSVHVAERQPHESELEQQRRVLENEIRAEKNELEAEALGHFIAQRTETRARPVRTRRTPSVAPLRSVPVRKRQTKDKEPRVAPRATTLQTRNFLQRAIDWLFVEKRDATDYVSAYSGDESLFIES